MLQGYIVLSDGETFDSTSGSAISKAGAAFGAPATVTDSAFLAFTPDLAAGPDDSIGLAYYARAIVNSADALAPVVEREEDSR